MPSSSPVGQAASLSYERHIPDSEGVGKSDQRSAILEKQQRHPGWVALLLNQVHKAEG
jgi:hypothetical protein